MPSFGRSSREVVVGTVAVAHFLSHFYYLVFPPIFPLLAAEFDVTNAELGLLFSLMFLMPSLLQTPVGDLIDRTGAKPIFVVGLAATGLGTMAATLAPSYPALLALAMIAGIGQSVFHPADFSLLESVTDESSRGKAFGTHTFAGLLGFAAGPLVVGTLGFRYGWRPALAGLGTIGVAYAVVVYVVMPSVHTGRDAAEEVDDADGGFLASWAVLADPRILGTFGFFALLTIASTGIQSFTVVFLTSVGGLEATLANTTLTANLTAAALGVLAGGVLADRVNIYAVLVATLAGSAALVAVIAAGVLPPSLPPTLAVFVVLGVVYGLSLPARDSLVSDFSTSDSTGKSFGFAYTGVTVGAFVAPVTLGFVSDVGGDRLMYGLIAVFFGLAMLTVVALYAGRRAAR